MRKANLTYAKWLAFAVAFPIAAALATGGFKAVRTASATNASAGVDIASELRTIERFGDDLVAYQKQCSQLSTRASLVQTDVDPLQRQSDDLKRRLSDVQNAIREVGKKLKAANAWTDLDSRLLVKISDPILRGRFQEESFQQLLEEAATTLSNHQGEVSLPLDNLRKKVATRGRSQQPSMVLAAYHPPASMKFVSLKCTVQKMRIGLIFLLDGNPSIATTHQFYCDCQIIDCSKVTQ
jgi:hypothetical protein